MHVLELLAQALRYPAPGRELELRDSLDGAEGTARRALEDFIGRVAGMELGGWEELYTRTFDLNPPSAPYLGYQMWGDKYQRGELLAELGRRQREAGIDMEGELPDHLVPVLRYLAAVPEPLPGLVQIVTPGLRKVRAGVESLDSTSPYLPVLDATLECTAAVAQPAGDGAEGTPRPAGTRPVSIQLTMSCHPDLTRRNS
jgi:nitrate reductase delta subunit